LPIDGFDHFGEDDFSCYNDLLLDGDGGSGNAFNAFCTARRSCGACAMAML
jgi:hypothetical protein